MVKTKKMFGHNRINLFVRHSTDYAFYKYCEAQN